MKPKWKRIVDDRVRHAWKLDCQCDRISELEIERVTYVTPDHYSEGGVPICQECGLDRLYRGTQVQLTSDKLIRDLVRALEHAQMRLNAIPHRYQDTDFRLIRETLAQAGKR